MRDYSTIEKNDRATRRDDSTIEEKDQPQIAESVQTPSEKSWTDCNINIVIRVLEKLDENPQLLDRARSRFERDLPPTPYLSRSGSTTRAASPRKQFSDAEKQEILAKPLDEEERYWARNRARSEASSRFWYECRLEEQYLRNLEPSPSPPPIGLWWIPPRKRSHCDIRAKHWVKRRWKILGVWNNQWNPRNSFFSGNWDWEWQKWAHYEPSDIPEEHRAWAIERRSFLESRPFVQFTLESEEEIARLLRIEMSTEEARDVAHDKVKARWIQEGRWKPTWPESAGWTWNGEITPEPESGDPDGSVAAEIAAPKRDGYFMRWKPPHPLLTSPIPRARYLPPSDPSAVVGATDHLSDPEGSPVRSRKASSQPTQQSRAVAPVKASRVSKATSRPRGRKPVTPSSSIPSQPAVRPLRKSQRIMDVNARKAAGHVTNGDGLSLPSKRSAPLRRGKSAKGRGASSKNSA